MGGERMHVIGSTLRAIRSTVLFVLGIAGIAYETLVDKTERPTLLILFAAMIGLPAFLNLDERLDSKDSPRPSAEKD